MKKSNFNSRRQFFKLTSISILGYGFLSLIPLKFKNKNKTKNLKKVKINSSAVRRK